MVGYFAGSKQQDIDIWAGASVRLITTLRLHLEGQACSQPHRLLL